MKCENCGKNEVTFVYRSNLNGRIEEKHLCGACAEALGYSQAVAAQSRQLMQNFFGGGLLDGFFSPLPRLLGGFPFGEGVFDDFFAAMPALGAGTAQQPQEAPKEQPLVEEREQSRFARLRQRNALRLEQKAAVLREDFERAAQLRDQLRELERDHPAQEGGQEGGGGAQDAR